MSKAKKKAAKKSKRTTKPNRPKTRAAKPKVAANPDCPYRPGTLYGTLFTEGNRDYVAKADLIAKVAKLTGKSEKVVGYAYDVLKAKTHRSNKGRSTVLTEGEGESQKIKIIMLKKPSTE
jgi:hypothetical protein